MNRIRMVRQANGLTMKQLGKLVGVAESTISYYESGTRKPTLEMYRKLAEALHSTVDILSGADYSPDSELVPEFKVLARAGTNLTSEQREAIVKYAQFMYPEAFKNEEDTN